MFCKECGKNNSQESKFCIGCGKPLASSNSNQTLAPQNTAEQSQTPPQPQSKSNNSAANNSQAQEKAHVSVQQSPSFIPPVSDFYFPQPKQTKEKSKRNGVLVFIIVLLLVLLAATGTFIAYLLYGDTNIGKSDNDADTELTLDIEVLEPVVIPEEPEIEIYEPFVPEEYENETDEPIVIPQEPIYVPEDEPIYEPVSESLKIKRQFLNMAEEIEQYSRDYLDTATYQMALNNESYIVFQKWDALLNEVYQYLRATLPQDEFERLRQDEVNWIEEKEAAIEEEGALWEGGSGEPMARNMVGISYTQERCYYLISLIK